MKSLKDEEEKNVTVQAPVTTAKEGLAEVPSLLLVLESCFLDDIDCSNLLIDVPENVLMRWESESSAILRDGLAKMNWWEKHFQQSYPTTYERFMLLFSYSNGEGRLKKCHHFCFGNVDEKDGDVTWRKLTWMLWRADHLDLRVWKETIRSGVAPLHAVHAITASGSDEFGADDSVYQLLVSTECLNSNRKLPLLRTFSWGLQSRDSETQSYFDFSQQEAFISGKSNMFVAKLWTIPFQEICLVLFENRDNGGQELVWVNTTNKSSQQDLRFWALNRNVFLEDECDFVLSPCLDGGHTSGNHAADIPLKNGDRIFVAVAEGCFSVVLGGKVVLVFEELKNKSGPRRMTKSDDQQYSKENWRNHLMEQFVEPNRSGFVRDETYHNSTTVITASCYVLDWLLLLASNDGIVRAHPRSNPKSEYYVENFHSLVSQMTSLYNVVAIIHSYCTLEVRRVIRIADDPFIHFNMIYRFLGVDCDHAPLLYGPYVIFAGLDGVWYRVMYDGCASQEREEIKILYHAGWKILSVKNANWKHLTVVVQSPGSKQLEELFLFM
jgi:hypothetical protein